MKIYEFFKKNKSGCRTIVGKDREINLSKYIAKESKREVFVKQVKTQTCLSKYFIGINSLKNY